MRIPVQEWANRLKVIDVWRPGNETGIVTDRRLYDRSAGGDGLPPSPAPYEFFVPHGTAVGSLTGSSLNWLARQSYGSSYASINILIPRGNNATVYKVIPDAFRANHIGVASFGQWSQSYIARRAWGVEIENMQNWEEPVQEWQYIKIALIYCYVSAQYRLLDHKVLTHALIADPHGRRTDPYAGMWSEFTFWDLVGQVRRSWPTNWPFPVWWGGSQRD